VDALCAKLKTNCVIRGGQKDSDRQANIDAFNADRSHVIICNIKAGGVGVSLHGTPTSRMRYAIICPTHSGQDLKQALGRVWRAKGAKSIQRIFFAAGTIEEKVCKQVNAKISRIDVLNDGIPDEDLAVTNTRDYAAEAAARVELPEIKTTPTQVEVDVNEKPVAHTTGQQGVPAKRNDYIEWLAGQLTKEQVETAHAVMRQLAGMDEDHAAERNDIGFSGADTEFGHKLANAASLSPRQAAHAVKLAIKYRKQVGVLFPQFSKFAAV
jgi:hypothetical protein